MPNKRPEYHQNTQLPPDARVCNGCGRPVHRCLRCREDFFPHSSAARYCSTACRVAAWRDRQEAEAANPPPPPEPTPAPVPLAEEDPTWL